ncbi:MAG: exosortase E/protease, VPEID-CTERM system, partial [Sinobacteraceae bacterium]|nr:exosortase E/protease, VPEID-CTERM system [Nevskiaceae bacterium]
FVDFQTAQSAAGAAAVARTLQHFGLRFLVTAALAVALFTYVRENRRLAEINLAACGIPVKVGLLGLHFIFMAAQAPLLAHAYANGAAVPQFAQYAVMCLCLAGAAVALLVAAAAPLQLWVRAARELGAVWLYALAAALAATLAIQWSQTLWAPTAFVTFRLVQWLLTPCVASLQADPALLVLATDRFAVQVSDICSGLEGIGLMLTFCVAWLAFFRKEYRFPHALLLIPVGVVLMFVLNVIRIAALVMIGHSGFPEIAEVGFHSQAGWIAFNAAACALVIGSRRIHWLARTQAAAATSSGVNAAAVYLMPLLAILSAGMIARAVSNGFELFYSLRLLFALVALLIYAGYLRTLDWSFSWRGLAVGLLVLALWLLSAEVLLDPATAPVPLMNMSSGARALWLCGRIATAGILVPVAEELAYRGFLLRRLVAADFEKVTYQGVGNWPLLASSVLFGFGHGPMLVPGVAAGLAYGTLAIRTGRLGEAVAAHMTTNLALALVVLVYDKWQLW